MTGETDYPSDKTARLKQWEISLKYLYVYSIAILIFFYILHVANLVRGFLMVILVLVIPEAFPVGTQLPAGEAEHVAVGHVTRVHVLHHVGLVLAGVAALQALPSVHPLQVDPCHPAQNLT
jgi:hypothetical protein